MSRSGNNGLSTPPVSGLEEVLPHVGKTFPSTERALGTRHFPFGGTLDPYWNSSNTRTADELLALVRSADPDERQLAAAMYDLPADLVSVLAMDTAPAVAKAALMQHRASEEVLTAAAAAHPEWASQIALHDNAPVHLLVDRPAAYFEEPAPRNRFLDAVGATEPERERFEVKRLDIALRQDSIRTVGEVWAEVRG